MSDSPTAAAASRTRRRKPRRVIGPRLRILFYSLLAMVGLLGANSIYLASITFLEWSSRRWGAGLTYQNSFYLVMFLLHVLLGLFVILPFIAFGTAHVWAANTRRNRRAVRIGWAMLMTSSAVLTTGVLLVRIEGLFELKDSLSRAVIYWLHVVLPLFVIWLYWLHRLSGRRIKWRLGIGYAAAVGAVVIMMVVLQVQDPRDWYAEAPPGGEEYFEPSLARTRNGNLISAQSLMMDHYCQKCHEDVHRDWKQSQHHLSSFNNPAYLATVLDTRQALQARDGSIKAARWCAGCHDPVPFFSGAFDDPDYDFVDDPTARAGITCTACHAITHVNSTRGNADYVIEEPLHYPFAYSENPVLQFINNTLVKAKPSFHKQQFLKPFHKTTEFCSACHKVHLPYEVTHYKEFLRGQNHYDPFLLSGVSGSGARSFYYPDQAEENCNRCHMPLKESDDFGAQLFAGATAPSVHDHLFLGANTGVTWFNGLDDAVKAHQQFLQDCMRVDIFGIRTGGEIDGQLMGALRPDVPVLKRGESYLLETVIRTLKMGHLFTQGTTDSNEVWLELKVTSGDRVLGQSGALDETRTVDKWAHFVNVFMLDRNGYRINRRNGQDIFVPLYDHQIPPGAGQTVHYQLHIPEDITEPIRVDLRLNYRKFDKEYTDFVAGWHDGKGLPLLRGQQAGQPYSNELPITVLAEDTVWFPVDGVAAEVENEPRDIPTWQRWNDYGIGLLLKGKGELRQAAEAFQQVESLGRYDGPLNLARVLYREGRLDEAVEALRRAAAYESPPAPPWTLAWLSGLVNREQGYLAEAERDFRSVLEDSTPEMRRRGLDFSRDYEVINELGLTLFSRAQQAFGARRQDEREELLMSARDTFLDTLALDSENATAHFNLGLIYSQLGDKQEALKHRKLHAKYKVDDNARDRAIALARERYPAANRAAEALTIYTLHVPGRVVSEVSTQSTATVAAGGAE
jgi:hypothetical protein